MKRIFVLLTVLLVAVSTVVSLSACSSGKDDGVFYSPYSHDFGKVIKAEIDVENFGKISLDLYPDEAPKTVANFVELANKGFYNNLIFHRIVRGFVIQGGDPTGTGYGIEGQPTVVGEFTSNGVKNRISHVRGVISMARKSNDYDSATSQFFIMLADKTESGYMDGNYAAFGCVSDGMDVVDKIAAVDTNSSTDKPVDDVKIKTITVLDSVKNSTCVYDIPCYALVADRTKRGF